MTALAIRRADGPPRSAEGGPLDQAWELVRRLADLRGECKLAWLYGWRLSRGGREQLVLSPAELAADQGTSSDAGRRYLATLAARGLVRIDDRGRRGPSGPSGRWLVTWLDPIEQAAGRVVAGDPQRDLFGDGETETAGDRLSSEPVRELRTGGDSIAAADTDGSQTRMETGRRPGERGGGRVGHDRPPTAATAADLPADLPAVPRSPTSETSVSSRAHQTFNFGLNFGAGASAHSHDSATPKGPDGGRGSAGGSAAGPETTARPTAGRSAGPATRGGPPVAIGEVLDRLPAAIREGINPAQRAAWIEELAAWLYRRVDCDRLRMNPCLVAAEAAVDDPQVCGELARIVRKIDEARAAGKIRITPSAMFNDLLTRARARFCF